MGVISIYANITPAVKKEHKEGGNEAQGWEPRMKEDSEGVRKGELRSTEGDKKKKKKEASRLGWNQETFVSY